MKPTLSLTGGLGQHLPQCAPQHILRSVKTPAKQQGISLLIALLVLVAMTLAGAALLRSVDSATLVAGNLAFRQSAAASADRAIETAIANLRGFATGGGDLKVNTPDKGYYAAVPSTDVDFTGNLTPEDTADDFDWGDTTKIVVIKDGGGNELVDAAGNKARYVVHRLCAFGVTALDPAKCKIWSNETEIGSSTGSTVSNENYMDPTLAGKASVLRALYRITVQVSGPRNTRSYAQAVIAL